MLKGYPLPRSASGLATPRWLVALVTLAWVVFLVWLGLGHVAPLAPVPAGAPAAEFSSARAMTHLRAIAQEPRAMGTTGNARARDYLVQQLTSLGLKPEVQTTSARNPRWGMSGVVSNVLVRLSGTQSTGAILLSGHYDTSRGTPGAADCGACTVSLLETLRALRAGEPLRNDVLFLFDDGEDSGLLGAIAFVREHPWAKDVRMALNLEARGSSGPVWMFQTSPGNGQLIRAYAEAAPRPVTSSFLYAIVRRLPSIDTNLTVFDEQGFAGLNFAFMDQPENYHSPADSVANLDERSLQHLGDTTLALTRAFGQMDLAALQGPDEVYFSFLGSVVHYPVGLVTPLLLLLVVVFLGVVIAAGRKGVATVGGIAAGAGAWLVSIVAVGALVALAYTALRAARGRAMENSQGVPYDGYLYTLGFVVLTVLVTVALYRLFRRRLAASSLALGAVVWWLLLAVAASIYLPEGSYVFALPLLFGLLEFVWMLFAPRSDGPRATGARALAARGIGLLILTFPAIPLAAPALYALYSFAAIAGPGFSGVAYGIVSALVALGLGLLSPLLAESSPPVVSPLPSIGEPARERAPSTARPSESPVERDRQ